MSEPNRANKMEPQVKIKQEPLPSSSGVGGLGEGTIAKVIN